MKRMLAALSVACLSVAQAFAADPATIDWSKVPANDITLFYPGQSSYQWLRNDHKGDKGADAARRGSTCVKCHEDEEKMLGEKLVKKGPLEPTPIAGKKGWVVLKMQAAYDDKNALFRFQWQTRNPFPGDAHPYLRFDGKEWKDYGGPKLDKEVQDGSQPGIYEDRMTMFIDDGKVAGFSRQGCWLTCHTGARDMPDVASKADAQGNALLKALGKNDLRKFLPDTRTDPMDWRTGKSQADIAKLKAAGKFLDTMQWRAHRSNPVGMADDGYVLEYRNSDAGKNMFSGNEDKKSHTPKYMWDEKKVGYRSITADQVRKGSHYLIREENAVPFDPKAPWKAGDMVPEYLVSRADAAGSAADNNARGEWKDGLWTVVLTRPLNLKNADDKALKDGGYYTIGLAVHDDNVTTRGHFVSFPKSLGFGVRADIQAVKLP
jgi:hypothetical protein